MMPAIKHLDPVLGVDIHMIQPPGPVPPIPIPHPHIGIVIDPFDYVPFIGSTVKVNGMHRAIAGTAGKEIPPHFPIGGTFIKPPSNENEAFMGSTTVEFDGDAASYLALPSLGCQCIGMIAPFRVNPKKVTKTKSLVLPTSVMLPIPAGPPVLIGGAPTISIMALGMRAGMAALGAGLKRLARSGAAQNAAARFRQLRQRLFRNMDPGFLKCNFLRAEPVDVVTGEVVVDQQDFSIPGRIPLQWNRHYGSRSERVGVCGHGWETPADARLVFAADGAAVFHDGTGVAKYFDRLPDGPQPTMEPVDGGLLYRLDKGFAVRLKGGLTYHFAMPAANEAEVPVRQVQDLCDNWLRFDRDENGLAGVEESAGRRLKATSRGGLLLRLELEHPELPDPHPLVQFQYDGAGDLVAVYDALDVPYGFQYRDHRMVRHTDRNGLSFHYEYDRHTAAGRCVHSWGDGGLYDYRFEYGGEEGWTNFTDSLGHQWSIEFNSRQMMTKEIDPLGGVTNYEYDEAGRTTAVVDQAGRRTEWEFDDRGNLTRTRFADNSTEESKFDKYNHKLLQRNPNNNDIKYSWNKNGHLLERITPNKGKWKYKHNEHGDSVCTTNPLEIESISQYDAYGNLVSLIDYCGNRNDFSHDAFGNVVSAVDPKGGTTRFQYDKNGRLAEIRSASGKSQSFRYDGEGNVIQYRHPGGKVTEYGYAGLGAVSERRNPDGTMVRYRYDSEENLIEAINERNLKHVIERDYRGQIVRETDYWGNTKIFAYEASGLLSRTQDQSGRVIEFEYDEMGRVAAISRGDGEKEEFTYDANGNVVRAKNSAGTVERIYDAEDQVVVEKVADFLVEYEYNKVGDKIRRNSSLDNEIEYEYDGNGNLSSVRINDSAAVDISRDGLGFARLHKYSENLVRKSQCDLDGWLIRQQVMAADHVIADREYEYSQDRNLLAIDDAKKGCETIRYDELGRVVGSVGPSSGIAWCDRSPDGRLDHEIECRNGTITTRFGERVYCYDHAGNVTRRRSPDQECVLEWDEFDHLREVRIDGGKTITFGYDPFCRRVFKELPSKRMDFHWDGADLLSDGIAGREFVCCPETSDPIAVIYPGTNVYFFQNDVAGLPREICSPEGEVVWSANYNAHGGTGDLLIEEIDNPIRLPGQYFDREIGLSYNRARYYDPELGAFISKDPLGIVEGENPYRYGDNVWTSTDPSGLSCTGKGHQVWEIADNFPPGSYESRQLRRFAKAWNEEIVSNGGSMTRRTLTDAEERASRAWKRQMRNQYPSRFDGKVVGHVPDAAAGGPASGGRAMALDSSVNSSIGGQVSAKPVGYTYNEVKVVRR